ncbi:MAG: tetratricopeptide repeat protein [Bauldia sp.]
MRFVGFALGVLVALAGSPAFAADWDDCRAVTRPVVAIPACTRLIDTGGLRPPDKAIAFYDRGTAYRHQGDADRAIADFTQAVALDPKRAEAYNNRGLSYQDKADFDRALADYDRAIAINPRYAEAHSNRGLVDIAKGLNEQAITDYGRALAINPRLAEAYFGRGTAYQNLKQLDQAIVEYGRALAVNPRYSEAYNNRADAYQNKGQFDLAIADASKAIQVNPQLAEAYYTRGEIYKAKGDFDNALADIKRAQQIDRSGAFAAYGDGLIAQIAALRQSGGPAIPTPVRTERRVALVVGNGAYSAVPALPNPISDAATVAGALKLAGFTSVIISNDLTRAGLVAALQSFARAADNADWAVIYYAGHGLEIAGVNYIVPIDAKLASDRDVTDEAISLERVMASVEGAKKLRLVVLDACRNNPFLAKMKVSTASRSVGRGLAMVEPAQATLVAYAAKAGSIASDGDGRNSPFAASFAKRLVEPGVEINKVFRQIRSDVLEATSNEQEPFVYGSLPPDDFFFVPPAK